jgi:tripartite-type tricarboxylate transporter receptor subunit TctC
MQAEKWTAVIIGACVFALAAVAKSGPGHAQPADFPSKPITMIVVFAAGGTTDVLARITAEHMGRTLGQQIVVENVAGAGGTTGGARAARAAPDGYTLAVGSMGSHSARPSLYKSPGFDPRKQEAIGMIAGTPGYFVVRKTFPAQTLAEYIAYAKANPGKITVAHAGVGSTNHLGCLYL